MYCTISNCPKAIDFVTSHGVYCTVHIGSPRKVPLYVVHVGLLVYAIQKLFQGSVDVIQDNNRRASAVVATRIFPNDNQNIVSIKAREACCV